MTFQLLASSVAANGQGGGLLGTLGMVAYLAIIGLAMYFIMFRPQRKKAKAEKKMRENIQIGDEIVTIGGIYGRVVSIKEDTLIIESGTERSKLQIAKSAIQTNNTIHDDV